MTSDIEELDVQKGHVVVHGIVGSIPDAQSIADALRKERCFVDVKDPHTNQAFAGDKQKYVLELRREVPRGRPRGEEEGRARRTGPQQQLGR